MVRTDIKRKSLFDEFKADFKKISQSIMTTEEETQKVTDFINKWWPQLEVAFKILENVKESSKTVCLSCGYVLSEYDELYEGYGCPRCKSPLVVKIDLGVKGNE